MRNILFLYSTWAEALPVYCRLLRKIAASLLSRIQYHGFILIYAFLYRKITSHHNLKTFWSINSMRFSDYISIKTSVLLSIFFESGILSCYGFFQYIWKHWGLNIKHYLHIRRISSIETPLSLCVCFTFETVMRDTHAFLSGRI